MTGPRFCQIPITKYPPATAREVETRYRCIDSRHEGRTYNSNADATWCLCGRVIRPGNVARWYSPYERAESRAHRPDVVGREAREFLDRVHGRGEPVAVPSEFGDQYTLDHLMEAPQ